MEVSVDWIKEHFPVGAIVKYPNNQWEVLRYSGPGVAPPKCERGNIVRLTRKSLARLAFLANATNVQFRSMITLTYPDEIAKRLDGKMAKKHLKNVLSWLSKFDELEYIWFAEFTQRGSIHFHVLTTIYPVSPRMRFDLMNTWIKAIMSVYEGYDPFYYARPAKAETRPIAPDLERRFSHLLMIQTKACRVILHKKSWVMRKPGTAGFAGYVAKYSHKKEQKVVPEKFENIGRFWGNSAGVKPEPEEIVQVTEDEILDILAKRGVNFQLAPKYLWGPEFDKVPKDDIPF